MLRPLRRFIFAIVFRLVSNFLGLVYGFLVVFRRSVHREPEWRNVISERHFTERLGARELVQAQAEWSRSGVDDCAMYLASRSML